jgi:hypothetical protein
VNRNVPLKGLHWFRIHREMGTAVARGHRPLPPAVTGSVDSRRYASSSGFGISRKVP